MSADQDIIPILLDSGYAYIPGIIGELNYSSNHINRCLTRIKRKSKKIHRIKFTSTQRGNTKYSSKNLYKTPKPRFMYYVSYMSLYPRIFEKINEIFNWDLDDLDPDRKRVITNWGKHKITDEEFKEYFLKKVSNGGLDV